VTKLFLLVELGLLGIPPTTLILFLVVKRQPRRLDALVKVAAITSAVIAIAYWLNIAFAAPTLNLSVLLLGYFAYTFVAASSLRFKATAWRVLGTTLLALPVLAGYLIATVGVLGLMFILDDIARPPLARSTRPDGTQCEIRRWGNGLSDSGYVVEEFQPWLPKGVVRRRIMTLTVDKTHPERGDVPSADCSDLK
jgi:hypothetical protein